MNETTDSSKLKKFFKAVGVACLPIAAVGIAFVVILVIYFIKLINAPELDKKSIMYFIGGAIRAGCYIAYTVSIIFFAVLSVKFIFSGIALIKQSYVPKTKKALTFSFACSLAICLASIYPFIINTIRIIVHGYQEDYYLGFWFGLFAFVFSVLCVVLNRLTVKKHKQALKNLY